MNVREAASVITTQEYRALVDSAMPNGRNGGIGLTDQVAISASAVE
jgi:hypothetical protein